MKISSSIFSILLIIIVNSCHTLILSAQEEKIISDISELFEIAKENNYVIQNGEFQAELTELNRKTAIGNAINPKIPLSFQAIDNITQQVSFLPGQVFGLPNGTYKEVIIGQQYISTLNIQPQFDILNFANIDQIKSSKINQQLISNQNKINEQNIYYQICSIYYNIISFQSQRVMIQKNQRIAEQIYEIINNRYKEGIARKQELNEAESNMLLIQDKLDQLYLNLKIQYQSLELLFENKFSCVLVESLERYSNLGEEDNIHAIANNLNEQNLKLQRQLAEQELSSLKHQNIPVLSLISSISWQNQSNSFFFHKDSNWIDFSFIGLKLQYDIPTTVQKYSNYKAKQLQIKSLLANEVHQQNDKTTKSQILNYEYEKSIKQAQLYQKIYLLKKDTYEKNNNQFIENILSLDKLLIAQNDMIISELNLITAMTNIGYNQSKIEINNSL